MYADGHGDEVPQQSVANNLSDEQIRMQIIFAKDIIYKYEYE